MEFLRQCPHVGIPQYLHPAPACTCPLIQRMSSGKSSAGFEMKNFASVLRSKQDECLAGFFLLHSWANSLPVGHRETSILQRTLHIIDPQTMTFPPSLGVHIQYFGNFGNTKHLGVLFLFFGEGCVSGTEPRVMGYQIKSTK